jgi:hypothetical protein
MRKKERQYASTADIDLEPPQKNEEKRDREILIFGPRVSRVPKFSAEY